MQQDNLTHESDNRFDELASKVKLQKSKERAEEERRILAEYNENRRLQEERKKEVRQSNRARIREYFSTGKVLSIIGGVALVVGGIVYRNDISNLFKPNPNRNVTEIPVEGEIPKIIKDDYTVKTGTYNIGHSITVRANGKLTLSNGVSINFENPNNEIVVNGGTLNILGTKKQPVTLDALQNNMNGTTIEYWAGIQIEQSKKDNIIEFATIRRVKEDKKSGGIHTIESKLRVSQSTIEQCIENGILNESNSDIILEGTTIKGNIGTGIHNLNSTMNIRGNSIITKNKAESEGGGLENEYSTVKIISSSITENQAKFGAGMFNKNSTIELEKTRITRNIATKRGGGIYSEKSVHKFTNVTITDNTAKGIELFGVGKKLYERGESFYKDSESRFDLYGKNIVDDNNLAAKAKIAEPKKPPVIKPKPRRVEPTPRYHADTINRTNPPARKDSVVSTPITPSKTIDNVVNTVYHPEPNHSYIINGQRYFCRNATGEPVGSSYLLIIGDPRASRPPYIIMSNEEFDNYYDRGQVQDLGITTTTRQRGPITLPVRNPYRTNPYRPGWR